MWMQLISKYISTLSVVAIFPIFSVAQKSDSTEKKEMKPFSKEIEANFLSGYYEQDGNNGAVTGGIGTEQLTDVPNVFIVNVPLDSTNAFNLYAGADYYSSASTDAIDRNVSSASSSDVRGFGTVTYSKLNLKRHETYSAKVGFSAEYDYSSVSAGLSYTKVWNDGNSELSVATQAFFDNWSLIYPAELRSSTKLSSSQRNSFNGQIQYSQVINKRLQIGLSGEAIFMSGLLSTPFHRVYFADQPEAKIERLPDNRLKIPVGLRLNYFPFDNLIIRSYYRLYTDNFGILGNTLEIETPIKLSQSITLSPFYRYHTQTASDYFAPYQEHLTSEQYYTSDYDLSNLQSNKYGLGFKYFPVFGILRSKPMSKKKYVMMLKYIELRGAYYTRSTGLTATMVSLNLGFGLK